MFREWNGMEYRWIIYEAISVHEIRPRVLRSGGIGTAIKRSVSDGASMDASWTSNGCSPLRRTYTTRIAHRFLETLLTRSRARLEARHSSPNCVQLAPKLFFLPIITCACIYIYMYIVTVAIKRHYCSWLEGQSGSVERIKFLVKSFSSRSLLLRMRLRSLNSRGKYVKS